jgi:hypothetical protein
VGLNLEGRVQSMFYKGEGDMFMCVFCSYSNSVKQNLKKHVEIHLSTPGQPCTFCGKLFKTTNSLNTHISTKHRRMKI